MQTLHATDEIIVDVLGPEDIEGPPAISIKVTRPYSTHRLTVLGDELRYPKRALEEAEGLLVELWAKRGRGTQMLPAVDTKASPKATTCAWCCSVLRPSSTAQMVKAQTVAALPEYEGDFVSFKLAKSGKTIIGSCFVTPDSLDKGESMNVIFVTCSRECGSAVKVAIQEEMDDLRLITS